MLSVCLLQDKCYLLHFELTPLFGMGYSTKPCTGKITYRNEMCHSPIKMTMIFSNSHLTWNHPHVTPSTCGKILQLSPARIWGMDGIELHSRITNYWWDCVTLSHQNPNYYTGWRMEKDRYIFQPPVSFFEVAAGVGVIVLVLGVSVIVWRENWMKLLSRSRNTKSSLSKLGWIVLITVFMKQFCVHFMLQFDWTLFFN